MATVKLPEKSVLCVVRSSLPGCMRSATVKVLTDADKSRLRHTKKLWSHPSYVKAGTIVQRARMQLRRYYALPCTIYEGVYLIPDSLMESAETALSAWKDKFYEAVDEFVENYPKLIEEAKEQLKSLFDPEEYPPVNEIRSRFKFDWLMFQFAPVGQYASTVLESAINDISGQLRKELVSLVNKFYYALVPGEDKKRATLRDATVQDIANWLASINSRNIANDEELAKVVNRFKSIFNDSDAEQLRADRELRKAVASDVEQLKSDAQTLLGKRKIILEDEEEE